MLHTMQAKFGLSLSNRAVLFGWATLNDLLDAAQLAEQSGYFHGVWVGDNLLSKPRAEAIVTLSAIAARTHQVKLGTICLASFPLRDPILLAIQWASLDLLSQGRTILAVCNGGSALDGPPFAHELEVMGVKSHERVGRVVEGMTILRRLWSEARVTHQGKYYRFTDVELLPKPVQQPVPIYMAINPREARVDCGDHRSHPASCGHPRRRLADRRHAGRHVPPALRHHPRVCRASGARSSQPGVLPAPDGEHQRRPRPRVSGSRDLSALLLWRRGGIPGAC